MNIILVSCKHPLRLKWSSCQGCWTTCSEAQEHWCPGFMKTVQTQTSMILFTWDRSEGQTGNDEVFRWDQPSLRIHFIYYPPAWNASMPLVNVHVQNKCLRLVWTEFTFTWFPSLILDRYESFVSVQQWWSAKPAWDDNYFIPTSRR